MSGEETKILMTVPKDVITAQVRAAVAQALAKDPEALVRAVVDAAMVERDRGSYSSDGSIWDKKVNAMIREVCQEVFQEWLAAQKTKIRDAVLARLKRKEKFVDGIADSIVEKLAMSFRVSIDCSDEGRR